MNYRSSIEKLKEVFGSEVQPINNITIPVIVKDFYLKRYWIDYFTPEDIIIGEKYKHERKIVFIDYYNAKDKKLWEFRE